MMYLCNKILNEIIARTNEKIKLSILEKVKSNKATNQAINTLLPLPPRNIISPYHSTHINLSTKYNNEYVEGRSTDK